MKWQILRFKCGHQQHYTDGEGFAPSFDRWSGVFEATKDEAAVLFEKAKSGCRKTNVCTLPKLYEVV